jgi:hypothetical protein
VAGVEAHLHVERAALLERGHERGVVHTPDLEAGERREHGRGIEAVAGGERHGRRSA